VLICEENIYMLETQNTLSIPQTTRMKSVVMGNQIVAKPNLFVPTIIAQITTWGLVEVKRGRNPL
jgi:hypothetical protein